MPITEIPDTAAIERARVYLEGYVEGWRGCLRTVLHKQLTKRFGEIPAWLEDLLKTSQPNKLQALAERILDAKSIEDFR